MKISIIFFWLILSVFSFLDAADANQLAGSTEPETHYERIVEQVGVSTKEISNDFADKKSIGNVKRRGEPEILITGENIYFNKIALKFGDPISLWKKAISANSRCFEGRMTMCVWDTLGLQVGTDSDGGQRVKFLSLDFSFVLEQADGGNVDISSVSNVGISGGFLPRYAFSGYLELDGFGMNKETEFTQIRAAVADRNFGCGLTDCSHPRGVFMEGATIYLTLNGRSQTSKLRRFSISVTGLK